MLDGPTNRPTKYQSRDKKAPNTRQMEFLAWSKIPFCFELCSTDRWTDGRTGFQANSSGAKPHKFVLFTSCLVQCIFTNLSCLLVVWSSESIRICFFIISLLHCIETVATPSACKEEPEIGSAFSSLFALLVPNTFSLPLSTTNYNPMHYIL